MCHSRKTKIFFTKSYIDETRFQKDRTQNSLHLKKRDHLKSNKKSLHLINAFFLLKLKGVDMRTQHSTVASGSYELSHFDPTN